MSRSLRRGRFSRFFAVLSLGAGVSARLLVIGALLASVPGVARWSRPRFAVGVVLGTLPLLAGLAIAWDSFVFSNFGFHARRSWFRAEAGFRLRLDLLLWLTGRPTLDDFSLDGLSIASLFVLGIAVACTKFGLLKARIVRSVALMLRVRVCAFVPVPPMTQYMTLLVVPVTLAVALGVAAQPKSSVMLLASVVIALILSLSWERHVCLFGNTTCSDPFAPRFSIQEVASVAAALQSCGHGGQVISLWPGYLLGDGAKIWPGTENHFGLAAADWFSVDERARYRLTGESDLMEAVLDGSADCVVLPGLRVQQMPSFRTLVRQRCRPVIDQPSASIFSCRQATVPSAWASRSLSQERSPWP
jgi:hypothetical protein